MGLVSIARDHERGTAVAFDNPRCRDSDYSAVPSIAIDDQAEGIQQRGLLLESQMDGFEDSSFFGLTLSV